MKHYIEIPLFQFWNRKEIKTHIPIGAGILFGWSKYSFSSPPLQGIYPKKTHEGKHLFTINLGILYFSIKLTFYKPEPFKL